MSCSPSGLPFFEKLQDESNYAIWKFQMELYLIHDGLWQYTQTTPESDELEIQQDQVARAKIGLMVEKECLIYLKQTNNAREAWEALRKAFENNGVNNKSRLLAKLVSLKLDQFGSIRQYVSAVMLAAQELNDIGKEVDDELLATILLQGLSEEYAPIRISIEQSNNVLTTDYVKNKLLSFEDQNENINMDGFINKPRNRKEKVTRGKETKCRICSGNHDKRDCPELSMAIQLNESGKGKRPNKWPAGRSPQEFLMDSGDYADMGNGQNYPCFVMFVRMSIGCLVNVFKLFYPR